MTSRSQINDLITEYGLDRVRQQILSSVKPSIELRITSPQDSGSPGRSRFGGIPDLPTVDIWPRAGRYPLTFIGQIHLGELRNHEAASVLPTHGLLSFFYDVDGMPWGFDTSEKAGWRVLYFPEGKCVGPVTPPSDPVVPTLLPACTLSPASTLTVPALRSIEMLPVNLTGEEFDRYWKLRDRLALIDDTDANRALHRILGHPDAIQGCMQRTVQFASRDERLPEGVYSYYDHPRAQELIPGAYDWRLLLQVDSDEHLGVMWGDAGRIFFWVHKDDLSHSDFSKVWLFLQCY